MTKPWFVIINPTSGNGASKRMWPLVTNELNLQQINFEYAFSNYKKHIFQIVQTAINNGFTHFIAVGGDGTLHEIVNAIFLENPIYIGKTRIVFRKPDIYPKNNKLLKK